jgi:hypothetical protein
VHEALPNRRGDARFRQAQAQRIQWNSGGYLLWGYAAWVDVARKNVRGVVPNILNALSNYALWGMRVEWVQAIGWTSTTRADPHTRAGRARQGRLLTRLTSCLRVFRSLSTTVAPDTFGKQGQHQTLGVLRAADQGK